MTPREASATGVRAIRVGYLTAGASHARALPLEPAHKDAKPDLRVVPSRKRSRRSPQHKTHRRHGPEVLSIALIAASLMCVVIGHALLAEGQMRLASVQSHLAQAQLTYRQDELKVARLETPARIAAGAIAQHMVHPGQIQQLPYVSLNSPLPPPSLGSASSSGVASG